jgi:RAP domain
MQSKAHRTFLGDFVTGSNLTTSKIHRAVSVALARIGIHHFGRAITMAELANEYGVRVPSKPIKILSIDIANADESIAIEVDGPTDYVTCVDKVLGNNESSGSTRMANGRLEYRFGWTSERQEINGSTALKTRLLKSLGWKVIRLPFWEWEALRGDAATEEAYCSNLFTMNH